MRTTETLRARMERGIKARREAIARWVRDPSSAPELIVVRCRLCGTPIQTTAVERAHGEPALLLDLRDTHDPESWECSRCQWPPTRRTDNG